MWLAPSWKGWPYAASAGKNWLECFEPIVRRIRATPSGQSTWTAYRSITSASTSAPSRAHRPSLKISTSIGPA